MMRTDDPDADARLACTSKKRFDSLERARKAAIKVNTSPTRDHEVVEYACTRCGGYHIGRLSRRGAV